MPVGIPAFANYRRTGVRGGGKLFLKVQQSGRSSNGHFIFDLVLAETLSLQVATHQAEAGKSAAE